MKFLNFFVSEFGAKGKCNPFGITKRQKSPQRKLGTFCLVKFGQVYLRSNEDKQKAGMKFLNFFVSEFGAKGKCNPFGITKKQKSPQRKLGTFCL
jgi:ribosomal protein S18